MVVRVKKLSVRNYKCVVSGLFGVVYGNLFLSEHWPLPTVLYHTVDIQLGNKMENTTFCVEAVVESTGKVVFLEPHGTRVHS